MDVDVINVIYVISSCPDLAYTCQFCYVSAHLEIINVPHICFIMIPSRDALLILSLQYIFLSVINRYIQ